MLRKLACVLALTPAMWLASAQALSLGDIEIRSKLNQRLVAVIPVAGLGAGDAETLNVRLASAEDFARAGIERPARVATLAFTLSPDANQINVSSAQPVRDPFLNFIVEARWGGGRTQREFTVLLDSQEVAAAAGARAVPVPSVDQPPVQQAASATSAVGASPAVPVPRAGDTYGPVKANETLWSIATRLRPNAVVTMDQMLLALYEGSPRSFDGGINGLLEGSRLKVPTAEDLSVVDAATAKARVDALRAIPRQGGAAASATKPGLTPDTPATGPAPASGAASSAAPASAPVADPATAATQSAVPSASPAPESTTTTPAVPPAGESAAAPATASPEEGAGTATPSTSTPPAATDDATAAPAASIESGAVSAPADAAAPAADNSAGWIAQNQTLLIVLFILLALILFIVARVLRSRAEEAAARGTPPPVPPMTPPAAAPPALDDLLTTRHADTPPIPPSAPPNAPPSARAGMPYADQNEDDATRVAPVAAAAVAAAAVVAAKANDEETVYKAPPPIPPSPPETAPRAATVFGGESRPDLQAEANAASANLDSSDTLTEAHFHLAYGLHDEAAQLLKKAIAKDPERTDLRAKLAETYFAAGKTEEFRSVAADLKTRADEAEWDRIAEMGRKLDPDSALFLPPAPAVVAVPESEQSAITPASPTSMSASAPTATPVNIVDFDLDAELPDSGILLEQPRAESDVHRGIEFTPSPTPATVQTPMSAPTPTPIATPSFAVSPAPPAAPAPAITEIDLSSFDLEADTRNVVRSPDAGTIDFNLDELDLGKFDESDLDQMPGDDVDTKLDLARAYADMGDNDAARSLLSEVMESGSSRQKQDAEALHQRLSA